VIVCQQFAAVVIPRLAKALFMNERRLQFRPVAKSFTIAPLLHF
jgi:hypothetical protein